MTEVLAKRLAWGGVGLYAVFSVLAIGYLGRKSYTLTGDPPIIVHGGSFRVNFVPNPTSSSSSTQLVIPTQGVNTLNLGYYDSGGSPLPLQTLSGKWTVKVCHTLNSTNDDCGTDGIQLCVSDKSGTCTADGDYTQITQLGSNTFKPVDGDRSPAPPFNHGYKLLTSSGDKLYPDYVVVNIPGATPNPLIELCKPNEPADGGWTTCWIALEAK
jgi:hypothetical protein